MGQDTFSGLNGLPKIETVRRVDTSFEDISSTPARGRAMGDFNNLEVCTDDSTPTVRASSLDHLRAMQTKKSAPSTPRSAVKLADDEIQKQQLQSIRYATDLGVLCPTSLHLRCRL